MSKTNQQEAQDKRANLLAEKAPSYILCLSNDCSRRENCLHWLAAAYAPKEPVSLRTVNLSNKEVASGRCPLFRDAEPKRMPCGLTLMYHDMPSWMERSIKNRLIATFGRKRYYEYHGGKRPLDPAAEHLVRSTVKAAGWSQPLQFNSYVEEYVW
ncbi:MAG: hypothetical protein IJ569_08400 [Prevotella sp.]|nr:hypothetical protein [Prevotella sp.]